MIDKARFAVVFFFFNDTATTEIYTLSLHDALPILAPAHRPRPSSASSTSSFHSPTQPKKLRRKSAATHARSEEHTSELQSRQYVVCRLLLEKKRIRIELDAEVSSSRDRSLVNHAFP